MVKTFAIFFGRHFFSFANANKLLPLNKHSSDTFPNTPDANCETVSGKQCGRANLEHLVLNKQYERV
jgi:hypothetical protein